MLTTFSKPCSSAMRTGTAPIWAPGIRARDSPVRFSVFRLDLPVWRAPRIRDSAINQDAEEQVNQVQHKGLLRIWDHGQTGGVHVPFPLLEANNSASRVDSTGTEGCD